MTDEIRRPACMTEREWAPLARPPGGTGPSQAASAKMAHPARYAHLITDLEAAWAAVHENTPERRCVGRPDWGGPPRGGQDGPSNAPQAAEAARGD